MTDSPESIAPPEAPDDPEIAAILGFDPVPRKFKRANGWTPALQRRFIAWLARTGSPAKACEALGKDRFGIEKVYKSEGADSFRAAWDAAIALFEDREAGRQEGERQRWIGVRPPGGVDHRTPGPKGRHGQGPDPDEDEPAISNEAKLAMVEELARKFMAKVMAERAARLEGRIVAADFYLRQVTAMEVAFDLMAEGAGLDGWQALREVRRGGRGWLEIAETPLSRALDDMRRDFWAEQGDPPRPEHPPERYCGPMAMDDAEGRGYRLEPSQAAYGALTRPAPGHTQEQWAAMGYEEQRAARQAQFDEDAAAQIEWEREAGQSN